MYKVQNTQTRITKYKYINAQSTKRTNTEHEIQILKMHKIQTRTMQDTHKHETQNTDYSETQLRTKLDDFGNPENTACKATNTKHQLQRTK